MEPDGVLIDRSLQRDQNAYRQLVERYQDYVFTIALRILRNREEAEEAAMDVFLKAYKTLHRFEGKSKFSTWLYTIAYRSAIDRLRTKQNQLSTLDIDERFFQITDSSSKSPEKQASDSNLHALIQLALQQLDPSDAALLSMYYLQEMSTREVASATGLSLSNVKVKLFRLRTELKKQIEHLLNDETDQFKV